MAKLQSYYVLCPLIDQKSFLGISDDKEDETVIVTLGRNVVNKYRLSDQKQTGGWTSKDHITAPVIYDKENSCYVGVFNNNTIKMWKEDSDSLDKVKKYKAEDMRKKGVSAEMMYNRDEWKKKTCHADRIYQWDKGSEIIMRMNQ